MKKYNLEKDTLEPEVGERFEVDGVVYECVEDDLTNNEIEECRCEVCALCHICYICDECFEIYPTFRKSKIKCNCSCRKDGKDVYFILNKK